MSKLLYVSIVIAICGTLSGCSSIQEEYKPLYQVKPQKEAVK